MKGACRIHEASLDTTLGAVMLGKSVVARGRTSISDQVYRDVVGVLVSRQYCVTGGGKAWLVTGTRATKQDCVPHELRGSENPLLKA